MNPWPPLTLLKPGDAFPPLSRAWPAHSPAPGLVAVGGALDVPTLLAAYCATIFPWFSEGEPILWWSPDPRMVLRPEDLRLHRSLRQAMRRLDFEVRVDSAFEAVMRGCAEPRLEQGGTWITEPIIAAYTELYRRGIGHCVETWIDGELAGGLYGLAIGRIFFGESMFARRTDASKIAFVHLVEQLRRWGFGLIDCQQRTAHLASFGAAPIPRPQFLASVACLVDWPPEGATMGRWRFDADLRAALCAPRGAAHPTSDARMARDEQNR